MTEGFHFWWQAPWARLAARRRNGALPHALLLAGPRGLGKGAFARAFAEALLCEQPDDEGRACGRCGACQLLAAGSHPDLFPVTPAEGKSRILIDQIRELCQALAMSSHQASTKVAVIEPADRMNAAAANSLLKTLEEPTDNTVLLLVTDRPQALPATVRSRCQAVWLEPPPADAALAWLEPRIGAEAAPALALAGGAPLAALALAEQGLVRRRREWLDALIALRGGRTAVTELAAEWAEDAELAPLRCLADWIMELIRAASGGDIRDRNRDLQGALQQLGEGLDLQTLFRRLDALLRSLALVDHPLNRQLLVEGILVDWGRPGRPN